MQRRNVLAGPYLDRASYLRADPAWFAAALADPESRVLAVWNSRSLVTEGDAPRAAFLELAQLPAVNRGGSELTLLGRFGARSIFVHEFVGAETTPAPGTRFEDLRMVATLLPAEEAGLLSYVRRRRDLCFVGSHGIGEAGPDKGKCKY